MSKSKKINSIRMTFKDNEVENTLYNEIMVKCQLIGQSAWLKQASLEKIERELQQEKNNNVPSNEINNDSSKQNNNINNTNNKVAEMNDVTAPVNDILGSLDNLFL